MASPATFGLPLGDRPLQMIFDARELNCPNKKNSESSISHTISKFNSAQKKQYVCFPQISTGAVAPVEIC